MSIFDKLFPYPQRKNDNEQGTPKAGRVYAAPGPEEPRAKLVYAAPRPMDRDSRPDGPIAMAVYAPPEYFEQMREEEAKRREAAEQGQQDTEDTERCVLVRACAVCGAEVPEKSKFCPECGTKL